MDATDLAYAGIAPRGVQAIAPPGREDLLLALAAQIEAQRPWPLERPLGFS